MSSNLFLGLTAILLIALPYNITLGDEEKDYSYHLIYENYYSKLPTDLDSILIETQIERTYEVQRGDNLHDISRTLFGDSDFWPKVWSLNRFVTNPHLIYPGTLIGFSAGTLSNAPRVGLDIIDREIVSFDKKSINAQIPPPPSSKGPIDLPSSLPRFNVDAENEKEEAKAIATLSIVKRRAYVSPLVFPVNQIILTKRPKADGKVVEILRGGTFAMLGEKVIISSKSDLDIGQIVKSYTVPIVKNKAKGVPSAIFIVHMTAELQIQELVGKDKYIAEVVKNYGLVSSESLVRIGPIKRVSVPRDERAKDFVYKEPVEILGGELVLGRSVLNQGEIVYLNKGSRAGIEKGDLFKVYSNRITKIEGAEEKLKNIPVSLLKIIDSRDRVSTGVLVYSISEVASGDYVGLQKTRYITL